MSFQKVGDTAIACRRFVVSGKVQRVFFRASTARVAERLGLRGMARNLPDGRVEVLALGPEAALDSLRTWLARGPPLARVDQVTVADESADPHRGLANFRTL